MRGRGIAACTPASFVGAGLSRACEQNLPRSTSSTSEPFVNDVGETNTLDAWELLEAASIPGAAIGEHSIGENDDLQADIGGGAAFGDYDRDGFPDLFTNPGGGLYRNNRDRTFTKVANSGLDGIGGKSALWAECAARSAPRPPAHMRVATRVPACMLTCAP